MYWDRLYFAHVSRQSFVLLTSRERQEVVRGKFFESVDKRRSWEGLVLLVLLLKSRESHLVGEFTKMFSWSTHILTW